MKTIILLFSFLLIVNANAQVPAFPGAGGGGAQSKGGRGGVVYEVINLDDSGPGSLRAGIEMQGPRTIVFRVGGTISIKSALNIRNPFLTIAGQTAPGGGIQLSGKETRESIFIINTNDVTIRYLRIRHGTHPEADQTGDPVSIMGGYNVIIDHCTLMWSTDENSDSWGDNIDDTPHNITWSWCIFAEPFKAHPTNLITGSNVSAIADKMTDIDAHHNLLANSSHRNPLIKNKTFRFVNNVIYNWRFYATQSAKGVHSDIIGNLYKPGPLNSDRSPRKWEIEVFPASRFGRMMPSGESAVYVSGNKGPNNPDGTKDNWIMVTEIADENGNIVGPLSEKYRRNEPLPPLPVPIKIDNVNDIGEIIIRDAGASHRLDCMGKWIPNRDAVDLRIINEYLSGTGVLPENEEEVGGFPVLEGGESCMDSDHDGMPDAWEKKNKLNPKDPQDGNMISSNGYSNLEKYLNADR